MLYSPFLGMDPYLEDPYDWSGTHSRLINAISDYLVQRVPSAFRVKLEVSVHIVDPEDEEVRTRIVPDVFLLEEPSPTATAVAEVGTITAPSQITALFPLEVRERWITILDKEKRDVVTTIELLSPHNKTKRGHKEFMTKRRKVMATRSNWLEIDLLRGGHRPEEVKDKSDYYVLLKRAGRFDWFDAWFFDLRDPLPTVAVPLRGEYDDVPLDLGAIKRTIFERGRLAEDIDYEAEPPSPALKPADSRWAKAQVAAWSQAQLN